MSVSAVLWLLALAVALTAGAVLADTSAVVDEVERGGIDALYAALAAAVTALAGWLVKRPQDIARDRKAAQGGAQAVTEPKAREVESELKEHLRDCKEYRREMRDEIRRVHGRLDELAQSVHRIEGLLEGRKQV